MSSTNQIEMSNDHRQLERFNRRRNNVNFRIFSRSQRLNTGTIGSRNIQPIVTIQEHARPTQVSQEPISIRDVLFNGRHVNITRALVNLRYGSMGVASSIPENLQLQPRRYRDYARNMHSLGIIYMDDYITFDDTDVVVGLTPDEFINILNPAAANSECAICFEDYTHLKQPKIISLACGHEMCADCTNKHFSANVKCPFCNQDLRDMMTGST